MFKLILSLSLIIMTTCMFFMNHPISMGMMILIQTLIICLLSGILINSYWFSYILFLTFLGGLLVLFIYVSSISSNELLQFSIKFYMMIFIMSMCMIFSMMYLFNNMIWMNLSFNSDMKNFNNEFLFFNNENKMNLIKLYNMKTNMLMMMLIIYLFISLIVVVKITNIFFGPLRTMY